MRVRGYGGDSEAVLIGVGSAHAVADPVGEEPAGRLFVPAPEKLKGWREYYIAKSAKPGHRPLGFGRP